MIISSFSPHLNDRPGRGGRPSHYVRDDRPFAGPAPPAAIYYASSDRRGEHRRSIWLPSPADCYNGFEPLFDPHKKVLLITPAFCFAMRGEASSNWPTSRRMPARAREANRSLRSRWRRSGASTRCSRASAPINGRSADERHAVRQEKSKPLLGDMHAWLLRERDTLSRSSEVLKPINYMLKRWADFARFIDDGRICLSNNAAERASRGIALGRRNRTFAGSQRGADRAAVMLTLITTARLNDVDPKAWLAEVLARIVDLPASRLHELLPWGWKRLREADKPADQQAA
ncbi:IS66 family transposase [Bradyrhizobium sp. Arg314]